MENIEDIHMGSLVKRHLEESGISVKDFAMQLEKSDQAVYDLFKKSDMNTSLLKMICKILKIQISTFFTSPNNYINQTGKINSFGDSNSNNYRSNNTGADLILENKILTERVTGLTETNTLLRKMVEMLESNKDTNRANPGRKQDLGDDDVNKYIMGGINTASHNNQQLKAQDH